MATFDNTAADPNTAVATGFSNTGASTKTAAAAGFDDTEADTNTESATGFSNTVASSKSPTSAGFSNTGAGTKTAAVAGFDDTEAEVETAATAGFTNGSPTSKTVTDWSFDDTGADSNVVDGEVAPVSGGTVPNVLTTVAHTAPLSAGQNYGINVTTRSANVVITLPDPPSENQIVEIRDFSLQASVYKITVDPGTKKIEGSTDDFVLDVDGQVLMLVYLSTLTQWKIV